jgi:hypothetical protein
MQVDGGDPGPRFRMTTRVGVTMQTTLSCPDRIAMDGILVRSSPFRQMGRRRRRRRRRILSSLLVSLRSARPNDEM